MQFLEAARAGRRVPHSQSPTVGYDKGQRNFRRNLIAFPDYTSVEDVVKKHKLRFVRGPVIEPDLSAPLFSDHFREELAFNLQMLPIRRSEIGTSEAVLFPILREVWKLYAKELALFSHEGLSYDNDLTGVPDYFICKVSEYGQTIADVPYLLVAEAKLDDFERAWGQCAAELLAAQKLNGSPEIPIYGITTNGNAWQFGMLLGRDLIVDPNGTALSTLDVVTQRLHAIFRLVHQQAMAHRKPIAAT